MTPGIDDPSDTDGYREQRLEFAPAAESLDVRRLFSRQEYPFAQRFAPYRESRWPSAEEFRSVRLTDVSSHGLSLLLPERPTCDQFVVELGVGENVSQHVVRVVHVTPLSADATPCFRVGCEIVSDA